ncbi:MAG TPA: response regulator transcription factor [Polyangiaceae bacterium]|nr:response regulator transcription factor [Polyangiaceae bacterium]
MSSREGWDEAPGDLPTRDGPVSASERPIRILVASSDAKVGPVLKRSLDEAGYETTLVGEGRSALEYLKATPLPDLFVLDLDLPDVKGTEVCRAVRSERLTRGLPILVVTAKDTEMDRVVAFELGADDFVGAPFSVREILLRVRVQLRARTEPPLGSGLLEIGTLRLDREAHRAWVGPSEVKLSAREFRLLEVLMERSERVLSRHSLLDLVWGTATNVGVRAVDAYVTRLRRKLGVARDQVETVSSVGYRLKRPTG